MKALSVNELRIGNYIDVQKWSECVTYISKDVIGSQSSTGNLATFIEPIPLTEEWLLKFGFEKNIHADRYYSPTQGVIQIGLNLLTISPSIQIQYVHQLQNLYFALTGKELTYEL